MRLHPSGLAAYPSGLLLCPFPAGIAAVSPPMPAPLIRDKQCSLATRAAHLGFRPGQFSLGGALLADVQQPGRIPLAGSLVTSWDYLCDYDDGIGQRALAAAAMGRFFGD